MSPFEKSGIHLGISELRPYSTCAGWSESKVPSGIGYAEGIYVKHLMLFLLGPEFRPERNRNAVLSVTGSR
jgi:hypothetical protein